MCRKAPIWAPWQRKGGRWWRIWATITRFTENSSLPCCGRSASKVEAKFNPAKLNTGDFVRNKRWLYSATNTMTHDMTWQIFFEIDCNTIVELVMKWMISLKKVTSKGIENRIVNRYLGLIWYRSRGKRVRGTGEHGSRVPTLPTGRWQPLLATLCLLCLLLTWYLVLALFSNVPNFGQPPLATLCLLLASSVMYLS